MTPPLEPIPIPYRERGRVFATEILPAILFGVGVVVAAILWRHSGIVPALVAEAEIVQTEVKSLRPGIITGLKVWPLQTVAAGETIGYVHTAELENASASLALIRAEIDLLQLGQEPTLQAARLGVDRRRLVLDWMRERVTLASLRGELQQAEADLARLRQLHEKQLVSQEAYDNACTLRERVAAQLVAQQELVARLKPASSDTDNSENISHSLTATLAAAIKVEEQKLRVAETQFAPMPLVAPIDGIVVGVNRRNGETVVAGEPIVTLNAPEPTRLVGFVRQPLTAHPARGSSVEVRTRGAPRASARATVLEVSGVLEPVPPTLLALINRVGIVERGLRVHISVPPSLKVRPGEIVDITFLPQPNL